MINASKILVVIEEGALARWVPRLVTTLGAMPGGVQGADVRIEIVAGGELPSALLSLLALEAVLYGRGYQGEAVRITRADIAEPLLTLTDFRPDLVIDLTGHGFEVEAQRLRPLYDGEPGEIALASALFYRGTPQIAVERIEAGQSSGRSVAAGTASLEAATGIGGAMEAVYSRVSLLLAKAISNPGEATVMHQPVQGVAARPVLKRGAKMVASATIRATYQLCCYPSHWRVGWRFTPPGDDVWTRRDLAGPQWNVLADPVDHFYADPFPVHRNGRDYLFFEDLDYRTGKGVISVVEFDDNRRPGPAMPVIDEPWHLSYPFLIEQDGEIFMLPESSANGDIALYRAVDFPLRWERHAVLVDDVEAADATIVQHEGRFYMFAVIRNGIGGYSDTLAIWWADTLLGPWREHAQNPVLIDDRTARPAGNMVHIDGVLYRPVQDCRRAYGGALGIMKVVRLNPEEFIQQHEITLSAGGAWPGKRLHTLNYNGRLEVIDGFMPRPKLKLLADMVDWWTKPPAISPPSISSGG